MHAECEHTKDFVTIHACSSGVGPDGTCLGAHQEIMSTEPFYRPALCRDCYVKEEEFIFNEYENEVEGYRKEIAENRNVARRVGEVDLDLEAELEYLQDELKQSIEDRDTLLKIFRKAQGVWGDG